MAAKPIVRSRWAPEGCGEPMTIRESMESDEFDLDISVLESGDASADLIVLTDDGCGSTCSSPCATNVV
jgi:FxLD family lantipeptide